MKPLSLMNFTNKKHYNSISVFISGDAKSTTINNEESLVKKLVPSVSIESKTVSNTAVPELATHTSVSALLKCLTATNLTQPWRKEHRGVGLNGGGPHSESGNACDLHSGLQWFRFTGSAGKIIV